MGIVETLSFPGDFKESRDLPALPQLFDKDAIAARLTERLFYDGSIEAGPWAPWGVSLSSPLRTARYDIGTRLESPLTILEYGMFRDRKRFGLIKYENGYLDGHYLGDWYEHLEVQLPGNLSFCEPTERSMADELTYLMDHPEELDAALPEPVRHDINSPTRVRLLVEYRGGLDGEIARVSRTDATRRWGLYRPADLGAAFPARVFLPEGFVVQSSQ